MKKSPFNPNEHEKNITNKIVVGLERVSEVFKVLLWDKAKQVGLSPIQIQILIFIAFHEESLCNVSQLSKEFNITKPTISDAIKILHKKELIIKDFSGPDSRSYLIVLSPKGEKMVTSVHDFSSPLQKQIHHLKPEQQEGLFETLSELIFKLNNTGILTVQRTCFGCFFYEKKQSSNYCNLLQKELLAKEIRLDCPEYQEKVGR